MSLLCLLPLFLAAAFTLPRTPPMHNSGECCSKMSSVEETSLVCSAYFLGAAHSHHFYSFTYSWGIFHCSVEKCLQEVCSLAFHNMAVHASFFFEPHLLQYIKLIYFEVFFKLLPTCPWLDISQYLSFCHFPSFSFSRAVFTLLYAY